LLLEALDNPHRAYQSVQIAGTNGKGSTAVVLDTICREAGISTGLFTSPHLVSITERIKIVGVDITPHQFAQCATAVRLAAEQLFSSGKIEALPTFFEHVTAIALLAFRRAGIDLAILETGLGGRLDATTVAGAQTIGITQIAMDHEEYLGNSITSIAQEKAAIIKPGSSVVIADHQPPEAIEVLRRECERQGVIPRLAAYQAKIEETKADGTLCVTFQTEADEYKNVWLGLRGRHQIDNVAVAIQLSEQLGKKGFSISRSAIVAGVETVQHAGRLEYIPSITPLLLDGAHNPAAIKSLIEYLEEFAPRPLTVVFGAMRDKRTGEMATMLCEAADQVVFTQPNNPRAALPEELRNATRGDSCKMSVASSSSDAMREALKVTPPQGIICVTGSLFLVGEFRAML
jgi:dihydrofolate synthase / folylpolyglutamate synthase